MTTPPEGWRDAKQRLTAMQLAVDEHQYALSTDGLLHRVAAEKHQAFLAGVLYGMALEATADAPLEARHYEL